MKKLKKLFPIFSLILIVVLAISACQPQTTPTEQTEAPEMTEEAEETEETEEMEETEDVQVPAITVARQELEGGAVTVEQVYSEGPGWIVIHADDNGQPGEVIGYKEVPDGVSNQVQITVIPEKVTETLYAMLHTDAGEEGTFEFPDGDDAPVEINGEVVMISFTGKPLEGEAADVPAITTPRQPLEDGTIVIQQVYSDGPGWIVIHADADGQPGPVIGYTEVPDGISNEVIVQVAPEDLTETLYAMLHVDAGEEGIFEFPDGPDTPMEINGEVVTETFQGKAPDEPAETVPMLTTPRQPLEDGTITIDKVVMDQPGWVVIHADADGQPGPVIGYIEVPEGVSTEVVIQVDPEGITTLLHAMLHVDAGEEGVFEFPDGDDVPVKVDGEIVTETFDGKVEP
jgi:hypothetical protein